VLGPAQSSNPIPRHLLGLGGAAGTEHHLARNPRAPGCADGRVKAATSPAHVVLQTAWCARPIHSSLPICGVSSLDSPSPGRDQRQEAPPIISCATGASAGRGRANQVIALAASVCLRPPGSSRSRGADELATEERLHLQVFEVADRLDTRLSCRDGWTWRTPRAWGSRCWRSPHGERLRPGNRRSCSRLFGAFNQLTTQRALVQEVVLSHQNKPLLCRCSPHRPTRQLPSDAVVLIPVHATKAGRK